MMSLSTVHGTFISGGGGGSGSGCSSPESSPRSTATNSSRGSSYAGGGGGRPPVVVSPQSPTSFEHHHQQQQNHQFEQLQNTSTTNTTLSPRPRMTVAELETVSSTALPPSQAQPHHPSYSFRRVRSLPVPSASSSSSHHNRVPPFMNASTIFSDVPRRRAAAVTADEDDTNHGSSNSILRLVQAVQQNESRPTDLTLEEKALWDAIQVCKRQARQEGLHQATENILNSSTTSSHHPSDSTWETRFEQIQEQAKLQQRDNSRSLQAIQRVLADVQAQRDEAVLQLQDFHQGGTTSSSQPPSASGGDSTVSSTTTTDPEREILQRDLRAMSARIISLERELQRPATPVMGPLIPVDGDDNDDGDHRLPRGGEEHNVDDDDDDDIAEEEHEPSTGVDDPDNLPSLEIDQLEAEKTLLRQELEWKENEIRNLQHELAESKDVRCLEELRKELHDKSSALENAKMIIGSLENASGSLAADMRCKMKRSNEEIARLQKEATENKRTMDKLATELKNLQKKNRSSSVAQPLSKRATEAEQVKRFQLSSRLETNMAEIFAASVVLESTQDPAAVSKLSELLTDSVGALKEGIDVIENGISGDDEHLPARLWKELEEKRKAVNTFEESLSKLQEELTRCRTKSEEAERKFELEKHSLQAEIKILRQQCDTNMEVLTRKERELSVLRDSLMVADDDVGYISDDEEDDDDPGHHGDGKQVLSVPTSPVPAEYGPSQAEALATLLAHGGNRSFDSGTNDNNGRKSSHEEQAKKLETVKSELSKARADYDKAKRELKVQKESLSNAKMIISSLERANKSMMEDLRARLQDSNTAIASLLEKSLESEKTCSALRAELDTLKKAQSLQQRVEEEEETALALPPTPQPLLLTETID